MFVSFYNFTRYICFSNAHILVNIFHCHWNFSHSSGYEMVTYCKLFILSGHLAYWTDFLYLIDLQELYIFCILITCQLKKLKIRSDQIRSVTQSCTTICDPRNRSIPGLPVQDQLPEFTQTHVHRVSDAIQPSHPLSSPSPPAPNPSQHRSLFQWVNSSHEVAKVLEFQL